MDIINMSDKVVGSLTVLGRANNYKDGSAMWLCKCICGKEVIRKGVSLRHGTTYSCGCIKNINVSKKMTTHGLTANKETHPLYTKWLSMKTRCTTLAYTGYHGRGLSVCDEWDNNPEAFFNWAMGHGWEVGLEIDRIKNELGYSPENCRFVTKIKNLQNKQLLTIKNTTGFRGVSKKRKKYFWQVCLNYKRYRQGGFLTPVAAAISRDIFILQMKAGTPLNFPALKTSDLYAKRI